MTSTHPVHATGQTQCHLILCRLREAQGSWVCMPELVGCSGSYVVATRVSNLRKLGHMIDCKVEREEGKARSFYRIIEKQEATL